MTINEENETVTLEESNQMVKIREWCSNWILWNNDQKNISFENFINIDSKIAYICISEWRKIYVEHRLK